MKIAHLCHFGPRANIIINQGLYKLNIDFDCSKDFRTRNKIIKKRNKNIIYNLAKYDIVFCGDKIFSSLIDDQKTWNKTIWYDYEDQTTVDPYILENSFAYFKRSLVDKNRNKIIYNKKIYPIDYCALDEYYCEEIEKTINISCLFDKYISGHRRKTLTQFLESANFSNCQIGLISKDGSYGRNSIYKTNSNFDDYILTLAKSKIVFTAFPESHDGDSRNWEAFSSRALVFRDKTYISSPHPLIDGKHFIEFDASNQESIQNAIIKAKYFLSHDEKLKILSQNGFDHVKKYHMAENRVSYMINIFNELKKTKVYYL
jgi:hypothetical protein